MENCLTAQLKQPLDLIKIKIGGKNVNNLQNQKGAQDKASTANNGYIWGLVKRWHHKLFKCPTFWELKPHFICPHCGKKYRCYWDGNDIAGLGIDYCNKCARLLERIKKNKKIVKIKIAGDKI